MLKVTTKKAADDKTPITTVDSTTKTVAKDLTNQIKERILKMTDQNQQQQN